MGSMIRNLGNNQIITFFYINIFGSQNLSKIPQ